MICKLPVTGLLTQMTGVKGEHLSLYVTLEEGVERGKGNRGGGWNHHTEGGPIKRYNT